MLKVGRMLFVVFTLTIIINSGHLNVEAQNLEENKCEQLKYALIVSLGPIIDKALIKIYNSKPDRQWAAWDTEILDIKQLYGVGGAYRINLRVNTYVGAHNPPYGMDIITIEINPHEYKILKYFHKDV
jgi:hypothetical protein